MHQVDLSVLSNEECVEAIAVSLLLRVHAYLIV
jgi:hypothetical protein